MRLWPRREGSSLDLLVVGLGNPGAEHERSRHNVGADTIALLKPETYMNDSGRAVAAAAKFFKVEPDAVLVVHDEGDFELGRLELKYGGGLGGHNGLRSIVQHLKTRDFLRLRIGVGRPERGDPRPLADYVLADFEPHDDAESLVSRAADAVEQLDADGLERAQARVNRR